MKKLRKLVTFSLDDRKFALYVSTVQRIIRVVEVTALPKAPGIVTGIINLQGTPIPVCDIRMRFRLPPREVNLADQMIVATTAKRTVALIVDSVDDVIEIPQEKIIAAEQILPDLGYVKGVMKTEGGMVLIHDLERFLSLQERKTLDEAMEALNPNERKDG
ncbi:MAG: purine-binding chemotaxis protein CheW [Deltaproteobacteria bacterium]|nr:purine-binding chemotaxis protein CheW [Deltaproteobacteria bacterium]